MGGPVLGRAGSAPQTARHLVEKIGHVHNAPSDLGRHTGRGPGLSGWSDEPHPLAIGDPERFRVLRVHLDKTIRIVKKEDAVFPFQCLAVLDQRVLMPVVEGNAEGEDKGKLDLVRFLRKDRADLLEPEGLDLFIPRKEIGSP